MAKKVDVRERVKLTDKQKAEAPRLYEKGGHTQKELAERFGCSHGQIWFLTASGQKYEYPDRDAKPKASSKKTSALNKLKKTEKKTVKAKAKAKAKKR